MSASVHVSTAHTKLVQLVRQGVDSFRERWYCWQQQEYYVLCVVATDLCWHPNNAELPQWALSSVPITFSVVIQWKKYWKKRNLLFGTRFPKSSFPQMWCGPCFCDVSMSLLHLVMWNKATTWHWPTISSDIVCHQPGNVTKSRTYNTGYLSIFNFPCLT